MTSHSAGALLNRDVVDAFYTNPLPGGANAWSRSTLGAAHNWRPALQAFTRTLASFSYPAALFWGEDLILLSNHAWAEAGGIDQQGQPQRKSLSPETYESLCHALKGGKQTRIRSHEILRASKENDTDYTLLVSPLFDAEDGGPKEPAGVLAQLLPPSPTDNKPRGDQDRQATPTRGTPQLDALEDPKDDGEPQDNVALDQHPFFHRFAEMVPCGIAILDHNAEAIFVNQHFFDLTSHRADGNSFQAWPQSICEEDYDRVMNAYKEAFTSQQQLRTEFRASSEGHPWRLLFLNPLGNESLQHVSLREYGGFICSVVDITSEKSAELSERRSANEARKRREQQEKFIDMISHEIRNPLSAVLHCSEDVAEAIQGGPNGVDVDAIRESIETIDLCVQHQQNIVNDVLSFSKLDSEILSLSPQPSQPRRQVARSLKMFQPEFRKQGIDFEYEIDSSYVKSNVDWVMADLPRIGQVLINLVTNAIKFTSRKKGEKKIQVGIGASLNRPTSYPPNVVFFNSEEEYHLDSTKDAAWGNGEALYVMIAVQDTGIGISDDGQKRLFERFHQATPKTEENYGGSGLGLNIARKICHIHGGEIGVSSKENLGSTFGFFFKVRRADTPEDGSRTEVDRGEDEAEGQFAEQLRAHGTEEPDRADESKMPTSLNHAPVRDTSLVEPNSGEEDTQRDHTAEIATEVDKDVGPPDANQAPTSMRPALRAQGSGMVLRSAEITARVTDRDNTKSTEGGCNQSQYKTEKPHVLLVEDNVINQRLLFRKLEKQGYLVTTANNGEEAVDAVKSAPPHSPSSNELPFDVILMDQEMPRLDGNGASRAIRELEENNKAPRIKILGVTANVRKEQQEVMREAGMDDIISKPYKIDEIVGKIRGMIQKPAS
ncbi:Uu.00g056860.m01.CDS01 [Anthostomella pinea]|uniref:histidine kinase n=1 Tax=Anthostomella pinea TaxID=933095 RepID=A0AAI8VRM2_9PEZI|nr:Uu.00g056860.m01.CDS01 [Anthostomella pinea]